MAHNCRLLDNSLYHVLRHIQEIDFVVRGFRLPHQSKPGLAPKPGRGTLMIARNLCQTVDTVLRDQLHMFVGLVKSSSLTDALSDEFEYILDEKDDPEP
ncbi:hypothetical protein IWW52_005507, partial [Coemansia sp. RSA 2704]